MRAYLHRDRRLAVFWSPKAASTAVADWFTFGVLGERLSDFKKRGLFERRDWLKAEGYEHKIQQCLEAVSAPDWTRVLVCRDPETRLLSGFINKLVQYRERRLESWEDLQPMARRLVQAVYRRYRWPTEPYRGIRFLDLLDYIEAAQHDSALELDSHFAHQVPVGWHRLFPEPFHLVRQESFERDIRKLNTCLAIDFVPAPKNVSRFHGDPHDREDLSATFAMDLNRERRTYHPANFLTPLIRERIQGLFADDYLLFGYPMEAASPVEPRGAGLAV
ncbi:MAG: sulfotransferase family 2 domain-containing protein [Opitutales bacterium]